MKTALSKRQPISLGPFETEAKAIKEGILFAWDVGICDVVMECNSDFFISALMRSSDQLLLPPSLREFTKNCKTSDKYKYLLNG